MKGTNRCGCRTQMEISASRNLSDASPRRASLPHFSRSLHSLDDGRNPLADADAHGRQAVAAAAPFHFMDEGSHDSRAAAAERMSQRDGAAIDIEFIQIDAQLASAREHLGRECFVKLDKVDLLDGQLQPVAEA